MYGLVQAKCALFDLMQDGNGQWQFEDGLHGRASMRIEITVER
jgi:hypothetical protein